MAQQAHDIGVQKRKKNKLLNQPKYSKIEKRIRNKLRGGIGLSEIERKAWQIRKDKVSDLTRQRREVYNTF